MKDISEYRNIIDLPHHVSKKHPQMAMKDRAAQFAPFAALSGFDDELARTESDKEKQEPDNRTIISE